jgi:heme/copper-type cytochrome/quinol oxidase subunit 2
MQNILLGAALILGLLAPVAARAADAPIIHIIVENKHFVPNEVTVPANKKVQLVVENHDALPMEFESTDLRREKIVVAHGTVSVWVGPLPAGTYSFFDDFGQVKPSGKLIAK